MHEQLRDLPTVGLIRRQLQDHLDGADELAVVEGGDEQAAALLDLAGDPLEEDAGVVAARTAT